MWFFYYYYYFTILWWFLPCIHMNQPWAYMCSPFWTSLPPPVLETCTKLHKIWKVKGSCSPYALKVVTVRGKVRQTQKSGRCQSALFLLPHATASRASCSSCLPPPLTKGWNANPQEAISRTRSQPCPDFYTRPLSDPSQQTPLKLWLDHATATEDDLVTPLIHPFSFLDPSFSSFSFWSQQALLQQFE